ncbi:caspase family protein [Actinoplanes sp. NBRC 103695]|uniref:caspase, EACC1-associated type n=1 Tax=Actinoplanes sp. NBRC 103695 TaxID=3032202 RepID=UPI0025576041|nr:caspase family protein [Actinoplanes sp. NBRC 103695]
MTEPTTRITVRVHDELAEPDEVAALAAGLRREILDLDVTAAGPVPAGPSPAGTRAVDLEALGAILVTIAESPVLAAVVSAVAAWLAGRRQRSVTLEIDGDVLELTGAPSDEQRRSTRTWLSRHSPPGPGAATPLAADGSRSALIVASYDYQDPGLRRLRAPARDAEALAAVLRDPRIGGFDVRVLLNEPAHLVNLAVEEFFADRDPDDLLLVHFSGHGVKGEGGELYFAMADSRLRRLAATAVAADFVNRRMSRTRSRRVVLLLDCCYAGAFERGLTPRAAGGVDIAEQLGGRGRAVITASSSMEYAFEGDQLTDDQLTDVHEPAPSVFSSALVEGLATGDADRDQDGLIALDELYDYIYDKVRATTPNQTPSKWTFGVQGELYIARRSRPVARPAALPAELQEALDHPLAGVRLGAVQELRGVLRGRHAGRSLAARQALEHLTDDDSRSVASAAAAALHADAPRPEPAPEVVAAPAPRNVATAPPAADRRLRIAGWSAVLSAALLVTGLVTDYQWDEPMVGHDDPMLSSFLAYALVLAVLAAGIGARTLRRPDGPAALAGATAASVWGLGFLGVELAVSDGLEVGFWFLFSAHLLLLLAAGFAVAVLVRTADVRFSLRPSGPVAWLVTLLGLAGTAALLVFAPALSQFGFEAWGELPWFCASGLAFVVPAYAAFASPRRLAGAFLLGWIGGGTAVFLYSYLYVSDELDSGYIDDRGWIIAFGGTLLALLVVTIRQSRLARLEE